MKTQIYFHVDKHQAKIAIKEILKETSNLIPKDLGPDLEAIEGYPDVPKWHFYENMIWEFGEDIRQILIEHKSLRKDKELLEMFLKICLNKNAKRGRQSFIMLFWFSHCKDYAPILVTQIDDKFVDGHIIIALNKMKARGFENIIKKFSEHKVTWIRNEAKKYLDNGIQRETGG